MLKADVCVCTRNRPDDLKRCIQSALSSGIAVNSIIVSDDSTDDTTKLFLERDFPAIRWIEGPKRGLGANRNRAISAVQGDFIIFLDDDAMLDRDFISVACDFGKSHSLDLKNTILTGIEINNGKEVRSNDQNFLGFQRRKYQAGDALNTIVINSALIPVDIARQIGFDELLVYGFEEVDFAVRARAENIRIEFCPELRNLHFPSHINRDFYSPFTDASRIYVTFKRYCLLEKNRFKAGLFWAVASVHLLAANVKRLGFRGMGATWKSLRRANSYKNHFFARQSDARLRSRS